MKIFKFRANKHFLIFYFSEMFTKIFILDKFLKEMF